MKKAVLLIMCLLLIGLPMAYAQEAVPESITEPTIEIKCVDYSGTGDIDFDAVPGDKVYTIGEKAYTQISILVPNGIDVYEAGYRYVAVYSPQTDIAFNKGELISNMADDQAARFDELAYVENGVLIIPIEAGLLVGDEDGAPICFLAAFVPEEEETKAYGALIKALPDSADGLSLEQSDIEMQNHTVIMAKAAQTEKAWLSEPKKLSLSINGDVLSGTWRAVQGARRYQVNVTCPDGAVKGIAVRGTEQFDMTMPEEGIYIVRVIALPQDTDTYKNSLATKGEIEWKKEGAPTSTPDATSTPEPTQGPTSTPEPTEKPQKQALGIIQSFKLTFNGDDLVITWDSLENAASYDLTLLIDGAVHTTINKTGTSHTVPGVKDAKTFTGKMIARPEDNSETHKDSPEAVSSIMVGKLDTPTNISIGLQVTENKATVTWQGDTRADGYIVTLKESNQGTPLSQQVNTNTIEFTLAAPAELNQSYRATVQAVSNDSNMLNSEIASNSTNTANSNPLDAPTGINAAMAYKTATEIDVNINWTAVANAGKYSVILKSQSGATIASKEVTGTAASFAIDKAYSTENIEAVLQAIPADAQNMYYTKSSEGTARVGGLPAPQSLAAPTGLAASFSGKDLSITWNSVDNAGEYEVAVYYSSNKEHSATIQGTSATAANIGDKGPGAYSIEVKATPADNSGKYVSSNASQTTATYQTKLAAPTISAFTVVDKTITATWDAVADAETYSYEAKDATGTVASGTTASLTFTDIKGDNLPAGVYTLTVIAKSNNANILDSDAATETDTVKAPLAAPEIITATATTRGEGIYDFVIQWTPVQGMDYYQVTILGDAGKSYSLGGMLKSTSINQPGVTLDFEPKRVKVVAIPANLNINEKSESIREF